MEHFTNSPIVYFQNIERELLAYEENSIPELIYCEMGSLLHYGFSIGLYKDIESYLFVRVWDAHYDNSRFNLGIFNIDRLAIKESKITLNSQETHILENLMTFELKKSDFKKVTLDGRYCKLIISDKHITWNSPDEVPDDINNFVKTLITKAGFKEKD